jgi:hypothetical protein
LSAAEKAPEVVRANGKALLERARRVYDWDDVTAAYEDLLVRLSHGYSIRGEATGRRRQAAILDTPVAT